MNREIFDRENPYELQFLPGESCFKDPSSSIFANFYSSPLGDVSSDEAVQLQKAIVEGQAKLKQLRATEEQNDARIKQLKGKK